MLKNSLNQVEIYLADEDEEEIGDETDVMKVSKIEDNGKDKVRLRLLSSILCFLTATRWMRRSSKTMWRSRFSWDSQATTNCFSNLTGLRATCSTIRRDSVLSEKPVSPDHTYIYHHITIM